jgi:hypothetical protein
MKDGELAGSSTATQGDDLAVSQAGRLHLVSAFRQYLEKHHIAINFGCDNRVFLLFSCIPPLLHLLMYVIASALLLSSLLSCYMMNEKEAKKKHL